MSNKYIKHPQTNEIRRVTDSYYDQGYEEYHVSLGNKYHPKGQHSNEYITIQNDGQIRCFSNPSKRTTPLSTKIVGALFSSL